MSPPGGIAPPTERDGSDRVELRVDPELTFLGLTPGDYRVTSATTDRGYRVALAGTLLPADGAAVRRPPTVRVRPAGVEVASTEDVTWTLAAVAAVLARSRHVGWNGVLQVQLHIAETLARR